MGYSNSRTREGLICCKCKKLLVKWEDGKKYTYTNVHHTPLNNLVRINDKETGALVGWHWVWDPSEGTSSGWFYDGFCDDCFRPSWIRDFTDRKTHPAAPNRKYGTKEKKCGVLKS